MKDHTKNRTTRVTMQKPSREEWMKYAGHEPEPEPTFTASDKWMFGGFALNLLLLACHAYDLLPEPIEWVGIGMVFGCVFVAVFDALRREFKWW